MPDKSDDRLQALSETGHPPAPDRKAESRPSPFRSWIIYIVIALVLAPGSSRAGTAGSPAPDAQAIAIAEVVLGIISYTKWPTPPMPLRICILDQPSDLERRLLDGSRIGAQRVQAAAVSIADPRLGADCNVVFSGALSEADRNVLWDNIQGHAVLTITEDDAACSGIIMFCLTAAGTRIAFSVNLDSVARSGLEVNPQVLLLGRRREIVP